MATKHFLSGAAQRGAALGNLGPMCGTCAFKKDSAANLEEHTVETAAHALLNGLKFNCHTHDLKDAGRPCVGFQYAIAYFESLNEKS